MFWFLVDFWNEVYILSGFDRVAAVKLRVFVKILLVKEYNRGGKTGKCV